MTGIRRLLMLAGTAMLAAASVVGATAVPAAAAGPATVDVKVVPALPGVLISAGSGSAVTDSTGVARLPVPGLNGLRQHLRVSGARLGPTLRIHVTRITGSPRRGEPLVVGLNTWRLVSWRFVTGTQPQPVPAGTVTRLRLRGSTGSTFLLAGAEVDRPLWVQATQVVSTYAGITSKPIVYSVEQATVSGGDAVFQGQQRFAPANVSHWDVRLSLFSLRLQLRDWLFGGPTRLHARLTRPDGKVVTLPVDAHGRALVTMLPRGSYRLVVSGGAMQLVHPLVVSRAQNVVLRAVTVRDAAVLAAGLLVVIALPVLLSSWWWGRKRWTRAPTPLLRRLRRGPVAVGALLVATALASTALSPARAEAAPRDGASYPTPVFAYYYIWFTPSSWNHAKRDYPALGRYSSDETAVMAEHIREAKAAGINGFLVSWKDTPTLDRRLSELIRLADAAHFHLGLVYEGLDVRRNPLPATVVAHDLGVFADRYARDPAFAVFDKPLVVWTGTWRYTARAVAGVTAPLRSRLLVLGSSRSVADYQRIQPSVDGDAYYWSSADPNANGYRSKLAQMGAVVHASGGLWVAPAAPGFDATLNGGHRVIPRADGRTLAAEWAAASASNPDVLGLISWNEFTENSYVEPSVHLGDAALRQVAKLTGSAPVVLDNPDSSSAPARTAGPTGRDALVDLVALLVAGCVGIGWWRATRGRGRRRKPRGPRLAETTPYPSTSPGSSAGLQPEEAR